MKPMIRNEQEYPHFHKTEKSLAAKEISPRVEEDHLNIEDEKEH